MAIWGLHAASRTRGYGMENKETDNKNNKTRKPAMFIIFAVIAVATIAGMLLYMRHTRLYISTDDAYVTGRIHSIAPKITGTVKGVYVADNQLVKKGMLLLEIDTRDYDVRVGDADAAWGAEQSKLKELSDRVDVTERQLSEIQAKIDSAMAMSALQEANLKQAKDDLFRAQELYRKGAFAEVTLEKAATAYDVSKAQVRAAQEQVRQGQASLETQKALIRQTRSAYESQKSVVDQKKQVLDATNLTRSYTRIYAPADGYVTKKNVEVGNQVQPGQPLMALVSLNISDIWIVANYKETQLEKVQPGQKVRIKVDMYPGKKFRGRVDSIMAGTGSVFSLFPPENATGNYVKVVQRIPVKIILDKDTDPGHILRVGMSVEPTIFVKGD
jgi:membrane fusion protein, multidrug efflux system